MTPAQWELDARATVARLDRESPGWRSIGSEGLRTVLHLARALDEIDALRALIRKALEPLPDGPCRT